MTTREEDEQMSPEELEGIRDKFLFKLQCHDRLMARSIGRVKMEMKIGTYYMRKRLRKEEEALLAAEQKGKIPQVHDFSDPTSTEYSMAELDAFNARLAHE